MNNTKENIYNCEQCDFHINSTALWIKHTETVLHQTGKRKVRSDRKRLDKCPHCEYVSNVACNVNMKQHILNYHSTLEEKKEKFKYYCENCDYGCFANPQINKHNND